MLDGEGDRGESFDDGEEREIPVGAKRPLRRDIRTKDPFIRSLSPTLLGLGLTVIRVGKLYLIGSEVSAICDRTPTSYLPCPNIGLSLEKASQNLST